jgi:hypothetical protein
MITPKLTALETEVINWLLDGDDPVLNALKHQFSLADELTRELTGHGFYLFFHYAEKPEAINNYLPVKPNFCFGDVDASIDSIKNGVGFLLWVEGGVLDHLEGYTYGEEWPLQINQFTLRYLYEGERDLEELRHNWILAAEP